MLKLLVIFDIQNFVPMYKTLNFTYLKFCSCILPFKKILQFLKVKFILNFYSASPSKKFIVSILDSSRSVQLNKK